MEQLRIEAEKVRKPINHEVKCVQPFFDEVWHGRKPFEFRFNDRDYRKGDTITIRLYVAENNMYCNRIIKADIPYVLHEYQGMMPNYCVVGLQNNRNYIDGIQESTTEIVDFHAQQSKTDADKIIILENQLRVQKGIVSRLKQKYNHQENEIEPLFSLTNSNSETAIKESQQSKERDALIDAKETIEHAIKTIERLLSGKPIKNLDEILADYKRISKSL